MVRRKFIFMIAICAPHHSCIAATVYLISHGRHCGASTCELRHTYLDQPAPLACHLWTDHDDGFARDARGFEIDDEGVLVDKDGYAASKGLSKGTASRQNSGMGLRDKGDWRGK